MVLAAFLVDGYFKYRNYKSSLAAASDGETAGVTATPTNQK